MATLPNELPRNLEAEQSVLGCMLIDQDLQTEMLPQLSEDDFYIEAHKYILAAITEILKNNKVVDLVTLTDELEKEGTLSAVGGIAYIAELTRITPSSANYKFYLSIVKRDSMLRKLIRGSNEIIEDSLTSNDMTRSVAFAEKTIFDISSETDSSTLVPVSDVLPSVVDRFDKVTKDKNAFKGVSTGYKSLDGMLNGFHKTDLMILAARPAMGKTSFALNLAENIALEDKDRVIVVFSLEMGKEQLVQRMICSVAGVSMQDAMKGKLDKDKWLRLLAAKDELNKAHIYIDDSSLVTPVEMLSKCRRVKRRFGRLDFIVIDYLQLMSSGSKTADMNRQNEVSEISRSLKILAKEIEAPVLSLAQLSRANEQRVGKVPQLSDLRDSGSIEQDADIVMFIHRPDKAANEKEIQEGKVKKNVAQIIIEKHRNGPTGKIDLYFKGEQTKFIELDDKEAIGGDEDEQRALNSGEPKGQMPDEEFVQSEDNIPPFDISDGTNDGANEPKTTDDEVFG